MANEKGAKGDQRWRIHGRPTCHGVDTQFSIFYNLYRINGIITQLQSPLQLRDHYFGPIFTLSLESCQKITQNQ